MLAWLLLPSALRVRRALGGLSERIDEVVAAQLWVEVRSLPWRRPHWVAAKVATRMREDVLLDCGAPAYHKPHRLAVVRMGPVDPVVGGCRMRATRSRPTNWPSLLAWACAEQVIDLEDRELLLSLVAAARSLDEAGEHHREGCSAGLSSRRLSNLVAREWGRVLPHGATPHGPLSRGADRRRGRLPERHQLSVHREASRPVRGAR